MMTTLVTGGNGFIGQEVVKVLSEKHNVISVSRHVPERPTSGVQYLSLDFRTIDKLFIQKHKIVNVVHCAWDSLQDFKSEDHFKQVEVQVSFLKMLSTSGVKNVIALGTCLEYGKVEGELSEEMNCNPVIPYAQAKFAVYNECLKFFSQTNLSFIWCRIFYVYGMNQRALSLYPSLAKHIYEKTPVFKMSSGEQVRDFISVHEVAQTIKELLLINFQGVVNISSGHGLRVIDFVHNTLQELKASNAITIERNEISIPFYEGFSFWGKNQKLKKLLKNAYTV